MLISTLVITLVANAFAGQVKRSWERHNWNHRCYLPRCPDHASYEVTGVMETWHGDKWPTEVVFTCWPGYTLVGSRVIECYDGRWSDQTPQCVDYSTSSSNEGFEDDFKNSEYAGASAGFPPQHSQQQYGPPHQQQFPPEFQQQYIPQRQQPVSQMPQFEPKQQLPVSQSQSFITPQQQSASQQQELKPQQQKPILSVTQSLKPQQPQSASQQQKFKPQQQQPILSATQSLLPQQPQPILSETQPDLPKQQQTQPEPLTQKEQQPTPILQQLEPEPQQSVTPPQDPIPQEHQPEPESQEPNPQQKRQEPEPQEPVPQQQQPKSEPPLRTSQLIKPMSQLQTLIGQQQTGDSSCTCDTSQLELLMQEVQQLKSQCPQSPEAGEDQLKTTTESPDARCVLPPYPVDGRYEVTGEVNRTSPGQRKLTAELTFICNEEYIPLGVNVVKCDNGTWSHEFPVCSKGIRLDFDPFTGEDFAETPKKSDDCGCSGREEPNNLICYKMFTVALPPGFINHGRGGYSATRAELLWHVAIYDKETTPYTQICGGSIISRKVVITAAHCFWADLQRRPAEHFAVGAGKLYRAWDDDRDGTAQKLDVMDIKIPPRYHDSATNYQEDIALVIVEKEFQFNDNIRPICLNFNYTLDSKQLQEGNVGMVSGWGLLDENGDASENLQVFQLPYVPTEKCYEENNPDFHKYITSDKFCSGYLNGTALCKGDSGGGLAFLDKVGHDKRYYLRGIASTAPSNDNACNIYVRTTFTHLIRHEHFIMSMLAEYPFHVKGEKEFAEIRRVQAHLLDQID